MRQRFSTIICTWVAALFCAFLFTGCPGKPEVDSVEVNPITWDTCSYTIDDHPCDFVLQDQTGQPWRLYDNLGSIIVIDFSTEWCGYCQIAASVAQNLANDYLDAGVIYVTIMVEDVTGAPGSVELVERWSEYFGITSPVLAGDRSMVDPLGISGWGVSGWPTFFFIDREMILHGNIRGWSEVAIRDHLDRMIAAEEEGAEE
jgi:thiol-disulfide isomerase/thioredoxin